MTLRVILMGRHALFSKTSARLVHPCKRCSVSQKRQNEGPQARRRQNTGTTDGVHILHHPQVIVPHVLVELGEVQKQRSRQLLPPLGCSHHHGVRPRRTIASLAMATPGVVGVVAVLPFLRDVPSKAEENPQR